MKSAYLETNVINKTLDCGISGQDLLKKLNERDLSPKFGIHGIYELARTFLNEESRDRGINLFRIIENLEPTFQPTVNMLLAQEINKLRIGVAVLPFLEPINQIATKQEVLKLARGIFDEKAKAFIIERESNIRKENPIIARSYIDNTVKFREQKKQSKDHPRTFGRVGDAL